MRQPDIAQSALGDEKPGRLAASSDAATKDNASDNEDEVDGWHFEDQDLDIEDPAHGIRNNDQETGAWVWEADEPDQDFLDMVAFPYAVSTIPEGLLSFIDTILGERALLHSPR